MTIKSKGVRDQQTKRLKEMSDLRAQGQSWGTIARTYNLDKNNVRASILNYRKRNDKEKGN
jgi:hypothetical protein